MAHSVERHLRVPVEAYDAEIRRLVPAYEAMRAVQLEALALALGSGGGRVLDLGGGTGALAAAIAERFPTASVEIWDTDPAMLLAAHERFRHLGERITYVERSFTEPLPPCAAVAACLSLHHVRDLGVKAVIYAQIHAALQPGGLFVNADTAVNARPPLRNFAFSRWVGTMRPHGIGEPEARAHFAGWAREDYYPPLYTELSLLHAAGFAEPECFWREGAAVVFGGVKEARALS